MASILGKHHTKEAAYPIFIKLPIGKAKKVLNYHAEGGRSKTHSESSAKPLHIHSAFVSRGLTDYWDCLPNIM